MRSTYVANRHMSRAKKLMIIGVVGVLAGTGFFAVNAMGGSAQAKLDGAPAGKAAPALKGSLSHRTAVNRTAMRNRQARAQAALLQRKAAIRQARDMQETARQQRAASQLHQLHKQAAQSRAHRTAVANNMNRNYNKVLAQAQHDAAVKAQAHRVAEANRNAKEYQARYQMRKVLMTANNAAPLPPVVKSVINITATKSVDQVAKVKMIPMTAHELHLHHCNHLARTGRTSPSCK